MLCAAVWCGALAGCEQRDSILTVATEKEAMVIQSALESHGVAGVEKARAAERRGGEWVVSVPADAGARARAALVELELPREARPGLAEMAQGFGLIPSAAQERARIMAAMAGELCTTLEAIDGVVSARVHVAPAREADLDGAGAEPGSAVVLVKYTPSGDHAAVVKGDGSLLAKGEPADAPISAEAVRGMVLRAVSGLEAARVDVVFTRAKPFAATHPGEAGSGETGTTIQNWRVWLVVLITAGAAMLVYGVVAARQFFRARSARPV